MMEIKVVFPHPDGPTSMSSSPRRTSRSIPRSAITLASPVPYVFVTPRQWTANWSLGPAASFVYSICLSFGSLKKSQMCLSEARLQAAARMVVSVDCALGCVVFLFRASCSNIQDERRFAPEVYPSELVYLGTETQPKKGRLGGVDCERSARCEY